MSSTAPVRRTGNVLRTFPRICSRASWSRKFHMSLSMNPGRIVLTRNGPSSTARARVSASSAANATLTITIPGRGLMAATPVTNVIEPLGRRRGPAYLAQVRLPISFSSR